MEWARDRRARMRRDRHLRMPSGYGRLLALRWFPRLITRRLWRRRESGRAACFSIAFLGMVDRRAHATFCVPRWEVSDGVVREDQAATEN